MRSLSLDMIVYILSESTKISTEYVQVILPKFTPPQYSKGTGKPIFQPHPPPHPKKSFKYAHQLTNDRDNKKTEQQQGLKVNFPLPVKRKSD